MELAAIQAGGDNQDVSLSMLSDVYAVAGWTLIKSDNSVGAWIAAERALAAAEQAGDVLRGAAAIRCLSEAHMRAGHLAEASRSAFLATVYLDAAESSRDSVALCLRGAALLSASAAAARRGDNREARTALKAASVCSARLGEDRSDLGTVFGPTNVAIHQVAIAVELGNAKEALEHIPAVDLTRMPEALVERRARFLIDVARAHAQLKDDGAALDALIHAERHAPDEARTHRLTHRVLRDLLSRGRSRELRALADRCEVQD